MKPFLYHCLVRGLLIEAASGFYGPGQRFLSSRQVRATYRVSAATAVRALGCLVDAGVLLVREKSPHVLAPDASARARLLLADFPAPELSQKVRMGRVWETVRPERQIGQRVAFIGNGPFDFEVVRRGILGGAAAGEDSRTFGGGWPHAAFLREMNRNFFEVDFFADHGSEPSRATILASLRAAQTVGAAVFPHEHSGATKALLAALKQLRIQSVVLFGDCQGLADASVDFNNLGAGQLMVRSLLELGHRDIVCVLPPAPPQRFLDRLEGARRFVADGSGTVAEVRLRAVRLKADGGIPADLSRLFERSANRPTAVLCTGIGYYGVLDGLFRRCRLRVPRDVAVIGCGVPEWLDPALLWLDYFYMDFGRIGEIAAASLVQLISKESVSHTTLVDMAHVPGSSLAPPRPAGRGRSGGPAKEVQKKRRKRR